MAARRAATPIRPAHDSGLLSEENAKLKAQLEEIAEERDEWDSLAHEEQKKRLAVETEIERLKAEVARLTAKSQALEHQFRDRDYTIEIKEARPLRSYEDLEEWSDEVLGDHILIHPAALKDCRKNGHLSMLTKIEDALIILRDFWIPAKLEGGMERWEIARSKFTENGMEDSACFVDREESKRTVGYSVQSEGLTRVLYDHIKYGNGYDNANQIRIYYFWDSEQKRMIIGKMPSHLRNNLTS